MPRTRKTQTGRPAAPMVTVTGQQYGAGPAQAQLQRAMPAPAAPTTPKAGPTSTPSTAPAMPTPSRPPADPMALAAALRGRVGLLAPATQRPTEPVTAGLTTGPGPGPEVLGTSRRSPLGETMRMVARQSGSDLLARLADEAGL